MSFRGYQKVWKNRRKFSSRNASQRCTWKSVVGLEVHAQINSSSKLFSGSSTDFLSPVNSNVSLFDCAIPGTLPVLNKRCIEAGVVTALALNCNINPVSLFDRKHYFYADLPAGYQITQQRLPLAVDGFLDFQVFTPGLHKKAYTRKSALKQLQLEQDSGRSIHDTNRSLINLNRAGIPLMELVFEPDLSDGEEAAALIKELIGILERLGTCSCKMEEGALRVDANVSIHKPGQDLGVRTEIKNIASVRGVAGAITYEIKRQIELVESNRIVVNETRTWDANSKTTVAMRDKEEKQDYRYMPEPNLPPLYLAVDPDGFGCVRVEDLRRNIPELPSQTRINLMRQFNLTLEQTIILVNERSLLQTFNEALNAKSLDGKFVANFLINDLLTLVNKSKTLPEEALIDPIFMGEVLDLLHGGHINRKIARLLTEEMLQGTTESPINIVKDRQWKQITDETELRRLCEQIVEQNPKIVQEYRRGKTKVFAALLGRIAEKSQQRANMSKVTTILKDVLDNKSL